MVKKILIIAEAGVNHNGSIDTARKMIECAAEAGADYIKFQTFKTENLVSKNATKAEYQQKNMNSLDDSQASMLKKLELSDKDHVELMSYCMECNISFLSTPFDLDSIDMLMKLNMPFWKIPSGEITNYPYLVRLGETKKPVILSTGMCTMDDIHNAVSLLRRCGTPEITLLHCNTQYPTPFNDVNLNVMQTLKNEFNLKIGYSDHTLGIEVPIAAAALGAEVIEKHFTLDKTMEGPDHKASIEPIELANMVKCIRNIEQALGSSIKMPTASEIENIKAARKSIVAKRDIKKGELFTDENITAKRPGDGLSPMRWKEVTGLVAQKDFKEDELITI